MAGDRIATASLGRIAEKVVTGKGQPRIARLPRFANLGRCGSDGRDTDGCGELLSFADIGQPLGAPDKALPFTSSSARRRSMPCPAFV